MYCHNCGSELKANMIFCSNCGAKIESRCEVSDKEIGTNKPVEETKTDDNSLKGKTDKLADVISKMLLTIVIIIFIISFFGWFDQNPAPALIVLILYVFFTWLEKKIAIIPKIIVVAFEIIVLLVALMILV